METRPRDALREASGNLRADTRVVALARLARGEALWLVGGALRDAALGRPVADLDLVVAHDAERLATTYAATTGARLVRLGGERFATLRLVDDAGHVDLLELGETPLAADLARRDLTVNALALPAREGDLVDPLGSLDDLDRRSLRASSPGVFVDDPLRVLRLARFALELPGFTIDPATLGLARESAAALDRVAHERIREELDRILGHADLAAAVAALVAVGAAGVPLGVDLMPFPETGAAARDLRPSATGGETSPTLARHWAELAVRSGGPPSATESGGVTSPPAIAAAAARLADARRRGRVTRLVAESATRLLRAPWRPPETPSAERQFLHEAGESFLAAVALRADLAVDATQRDSWRRLAERLAAFDDATRGQILAPRPWLDGGRIAAMLGVGPGPEIGKALAALVREQVAGRVDSEAAAERFLRRWKEERDAG